MGMKYEYEAWDRGEVSFDYNRLEDGKLIAAYRDFASWAIEQDRAERDREFLRSVGIKP